MPKVFGTKRESPTAGRGSIKINLDTLKRTNFAFPSEFYCETSDKNPVNISYRYGRIEIKINGASYLTTCKDEFDVGGYIEDKELIDILKKENLV